MSPVRLGFLSDPLVAPPPALQADLSLAGLASHTAIVAQSGFGKSFALGRLIEEIGLATNGKVIILDPDSDFLRFSEVEESRWSES
jgi:DNA helicase HerA-like ATPase